jgi:nicotinamidase-related amidase
MNGSAAEREVLIIIDPQIDFCTGGALAVPGGDEIVPTVNRLARDFPHVILTQDRHPPGHRSFASAHPGRGPSRLSKSITARRRCGPTTAYKGQRVRISCPLARLAMLPPLKAQCRRPEGGVFAAQYPAYAHPCHRFTETLAGFSA